MRNLQPRLVNTLETFNCAKIAYIGDGKWKWCSNRTGLVFSVDPEIYSTKTANEILKFAGIDPLF